MMENSLDIKCVKVEPDYPEATADLEVPIETKINKDLYLLNTEIDFKSESKGDETEKNQTNVQIECKNSQDEMPQDPLNASNNIEEEDTVEVYSTKELNIVEGNLLQDFREEHFLNMVGENSQDQQAYDQPNSEHTNKNNKTFFCPVCGKMFGRKGNLNYHIRIHTGVKPYKCDVCAKMFGLKNSLNKHMLIHIGEKPYECSVCQKKFGQKMVLLRHELIHSGERPFKCDQCEKQFTQKNALVDHIRVHTGEKPYKCEQCSKQFKQRSALDEHKNIHTGEKPYMCDICNKHFAQKSVLIQHKRIHMKEKPFSCGVCNRSFNRKDALKRHILTHKN